MKKALYITNSFERIFCPDCTARIAELVELIGPPQGADVLATAPELLNDVEIVLSGWGAPILDEAFLMAAPRLELFLYAAGTIRGFVTEDFWRRGIPICSAWAANAIPVAEYTLSQILFCLKFGYQFMGAFKRQQPRPPCGPGALCGAYGNTVGIISLGMIGRKVVELLRPFGLTVLAYDPFVSSDDAAELGVELAPLDELFRRSAVVSLHAPWTKETENLIRGRHFEMLRPHASFINTARGAVVHEGEMIETLRRRDDVVVVLDVTHPEPPPPDSPLWSMPNVFLTPHIAGSLGAECYRMGYFMLDELRRYLVGQPLRWRVSRDMSHHRGIH